MIIDLNIYAFILNIFLHLMLLPELKSLVSVNRLFCKLTDFNITCLFSSLFLISFIIIIPIFSIVSILSCIKIAYYPGQKCIIRSYATVLLIYFTGFNLKQLKQIYLFLLKLGSSQKYYNFIRYSKNIDMLISYYFTYDIVISCLMHSMIFIALLMLCEYFLAYKYTTLNFEGIIIFLAKSKILLLSIFSVIITYILVLYTAETLCSIRIELRDEIAGYYILLAYESTFVNGILLYIYALSVI